MDSTNILFVAMGVVLASWFAVAGLAQASGGAPTDADLNAIYRLLKDSDRSVVDQLTPEQRRQYLASKWEAQKKAEGSGVPRYVAPDVAPSSPTLYSLDPLLRSAYEAYVDENRPSSDAIALLKRYAAETPTSEFMPEVFFRLGALHSMHTREGEPVNIPMEIEYFQKAHDLYGKSFDPIHEACWGTLANRSHSLAEHRKHYDWLLALQASGTVNDICGIREIGATRNGRYPRKSPDDLLVELKTMKQNLPDYITTAEDNILHFVSNNYACLAELASAYPNTRLGRLASERLARLDRKSSLGAVRRINDPEFMESNLGMRTSSRGTSEATASSTGASGQSGKQGRRDANLVPPLAALVILVGVAGLSVAIAVLVKRRRPANGVNRNKQATQQN